MRDWKAQGSALDLATSSGAVKLLTEKDNSQREES
jgi:hypothetical protein